MTYRHMDIFDSVQHLAPDRSEVQRQCRRWVYDAADNYNLMIITSRIRSIVNPYVREYTCTIMHEIVTEIATQEAGEYGMSGMAVEMIENDLRRIVRLAWDEQTEDQLVEAREAVSGEAAIHIKQSAIDTLEARMNARLDEMKENYDEEIRVLHEKIDRQREEAQEAKRWKWPFYTAKAAEGDKQTFEEILEGLCKDSKTHDAKAYLKLKEDQGLIIRPKVLKDEWEIVKGFGYKSKYAAYNKA